MNLQFIRKKLSISNLLNVFFIVALLIVLFNPNAKAFLIRGLMKVGLFQPDISHPVKTTESTGLPAISFQNANGQILNLNDQKGKVIFINFWATWCPPCIAEMPSINNLFEKLKDNKNIIFMMVDADHDFSKSLPFINKHQFAFPLYEANSDIPANLLGNSIPTTLIFDKSGQLVFRHEGAADYSSAKVLDYLLELSR